MTSFPVPLSPVIITLASVGATLRASSTALRNAGATPSSVILSLFPFCCTSCWRSAFVSRVTITACEARPTSTCRCVAEKGLGR